MPHGLFITGSDTGVGKTWIGTALLDLISRQGVRVRPRKPVESGCTDGSDGLVPQDGVSYYKAAGGAEPLSRICRFRLQPALSPDRAAAIQGVEICLQDVIEACLNGVEENDFLLVEGAGGFCSPLASDGLNADLALSIGLPVLLVTTDRLGAIHQTIATAESIAHRGLTLAGVVLNSATPVSDARMENAKFLSRWLGQKVIEVSHFLPPEISCWSEQVPGLLDLANRLVDQSRQKSIAHK